MNTAMPVSAAVIGLGSMGLGMALSLARAGIPKAAHSPLAQVPVIGLELLEAVRDGHITVRGGIDHLSPRTVHFTDSRADPYDAILLATGYTPVVDFLRPLATDPTTLIPATGVTSPTEPGLYFVGLHRSTQGVLYLISRHEAPEAARLIVRQLRQSAA